MKASASAATSVIDMAERTALPTIQYSRRAQAGETPYPVVGEHPPLETAGSA